MFHIKATNITWYIKGEAVNCGKLKAKATLLLQDIKTSFKCDVDTGVKSQEKK